MLTLITGGVKSGKSRRALEISLGMEKPVSFIATSEVLDEEMRERIAVHRAERAALAGQDAFSVIEEPLEIGGALSRAGKNVLLDCVPMWVNNLMYYKREADFDRILADFVDDVALHNVVVVTNETGLGNIPFDGETRRYNLLLAKANRLLAEAATTVEFIVSGLVLKIK